MHLNHYILNRLVNIYENNRYFYNFDYTALKYDLNEFLDTIDSNKLFRTIIRNYGIHSRCKESCDSAINCYLSDMTSLYLNNKESVINNLNKNIVDHTISRLYLIIITIRNTIENYEICNNM